MLEDLRLAHRANQVWEISGIDSPDRCRDLEHYKNYPYLIEYQYNSRGFRDSEWPEDLCNKIWAIGDSYTVGLGSPVEHSWPYLLQERLNQRVINVSMDGASNNWIARRAREIIQHAKPAAVVIQWSHIERREDSIRDYVNKNWHIHYETVRGDNWPECPDLEHWDSLPNHIKIELLTQHDLSWRNDISDEDLRLGLIKCTREEDVANTLDCIQSVESTCVIHSFIPDFADAKSQKLIMTELSKQPRTVIPSIKPVDIARDGLHYDILTAKNFVNCLLTALPDAITSPQHS